MAEDRHVTQRDVAEKAGVSVMTVSRTLSGKGRVKTETRNRILEVAEEMGYKPNPLVESLMRTRRRKSVPDSGVAIAWYGVTSSYEYKPDVQAHYDTFAEYFKGVQAVCSQRNFQLEVFSSEELSEKRLLGVLHARGIRGLLIGPALRSQWSYPLRKDPDLHVIQIGRSQHVTGCDRVVSDSYLSIRHSVRFLREQGFRSVGYVDMSQRAQRGEQRWQAGYAMEIQDQPELMRLFHHPSKVPDELDAFLDHCQPDALIVGGNQAVNAVTRHPEAPPFVVLDRNGRPDWITGTEPRHFDMGMEAGRRLIDALLGPQNVILQGHSISLTENWVVGTSHLPK